MILIPSSNPEEGSYQEGAQCALHMHVVHPTHPTHPTNFLLPTNFPPTSFNSSICDDSDHLR